jgi:hypothetical protein
MYYLASDELQGRYPGTSGYDKAAEYAVAQFRQSGLKPVMVGTNGDSSYFQQVPFKVVKWDLKNELTVYNGKKATTFPIKKNFLFWSLFSNISPAPAEMEGGVVFISSGIKEPEYGIDNYKNVNAKGKWLLMYADADAYKTVLPEKVCKKYADGQGRDKFFEESGAIGVILIPSKIFYAFWGPLAEFLQSQTGLDVNEGKFSSNTTMLAVDSVIILSLFKYAEKNPWNDGFIMESFEIKDVKIKVTKKYSTVVYSSPNVIGLLPGSHPDLQHEFIAVGAHLDHIGILQNEICNGADDNASGCVALIEIAEALSVSGTKRPLLFNLFTGEEFGMLGSEYFTGNPPMPIENLKSFVNMDMIGRSDGDVEKDLAPISINYWEKLAEFGRENPQLELDWAYADTSQFINGSDHYSFQQKGIPSVFFFNGLHADWHRPGDDAEKIDYVYLQKNSQFVYRFLLELANE